MGTVAALLLFLAGAAVAPQPHVVFLCNEDEYRARNTLPAFARDLREKFGCRCTVLIGKGDDGFKSLEALKSADVLIIFVRRRALPKEQLDAIRAYCDAGKPVVGLRTASHAFAKKTKTPAGHAQWPEFDRDVLGGNYHNHGKSATEVSLAPNAAGHPLLAGIDPKKWTSKSTLYFASPLDKKAHALLLGSSEGKTEPVAWTHAYKGGRVFYTSLGHQDDFAAPQFRTLLVNAIFWSMDRPLSNGKNPARENP
ncbi:MAG: ThuA domain-containing protein [Pirellulales bacterium]|nr:ThuA domain-containing protein [Pirellulales bacterium]